jgi:opacity protein-like surface antigen
VVKDNNFNLNTLTVDDWSFDGTLRFFLMDGFNIFVRGYYGNQKTTSDPTKLERYEGLGLKSQSAWKLDGLEFGIMGYLGNVMMKNSKFNPYLTAAGGVVDWELTTEARGTAPIVLEQESLKGEDLAFAFGLGTEYELSQRLQLEFEWLWRYFLTEDTTKWPDTDDTWSNTHAWSFSLGITWGFL